jgi:hypothetical protein
MHISVSDKDLLTVLKNDYISNDIKEDRLYFADFFEILGVLPEPTVRIEIKLYVLNYIITNHPYGFDEVLRTIMDITDDRQRAVLLKEYIVNSVNKLTISTFCKVVGYLNIDIQCAAELKEIHDTYGIPFFNEHKHECFCVEAYCYTFYNCLTDFEKETFTNILVKVLKCRHIEKAIHKIKFSDEQMSKLNSKLILYQLAQSS